MIRYLEISQTLCDATFGVFVLSWLVTRIFLFSLAILSTFRDVERLTPLKWAPEEGYYVTKDVLTVFRSLLMALLVCFVSAKLITYAHIYGYLQIIQMIWFGMIIRVVWRVLTTKGGASDDRSDEEV